MASFKESLSKVISNFIFIVTQFVLWNICIKSEKVKVTIENALFLLLSFLIASIIGWLFCTSQNNLTSYK